MPLRIATADETGKTLFATLERLSDGFYWDAAGSAWAAAPAAADRKVVLVEGAGANSGSYAASVAGLGDAGDVLVRVHDDAHAADATVRGGVSYVWGGNEVGWAEVLAVKVRTDRIGTGRLSTVSPVAVGGRLSLFRGDTYSDAIGRALEWSDDGQAAWPDLTGATITLEANDGDMVVVGSVVGDPAGTPKRVRAEPTADDTNGLQPGVYDYRVVATFAGGVRASLGSGRVEVFDREDA